MSSRTRCWTQVTLVVGVLVSSPVWGGSLSLTDIAWMEGHWVMETAGGRAEEIWTAPRDGTMVGSFRWAMPGRRPVLEFSVIEETAGEVLFRFKHFDPEYQPWEKDEPNVYRLDEVGDRRAVFVNVAWNGRVPQRLIYSRPEPDRLDFRGESPDADAAPLILEFVRRNTGLDERSRPEEKAMRQEDQDRRIDYIELSVPDLERTKRFYTTVFGWSFTDYGPDYTSFRDGRLSGGFSKGDAVTSGGPLLVIYALDLEQIAEAVVAHGGSIVRKPFEFPGGRRFHFRDPSGYELAVWSDQKP